MIDDEKKEGSSSLFKEHEFIFSLTVFIIFIAFIILFFGNNITFVKTCGDGTLYSSCSETMPYYCDSGILVEKASVCGCMENSSITGDQCISLYQTGPKEIILKQDRIDDWKKKGADLSDGLLRIIKQAPQKPPRKKTKYF